MMRLETVYGMVEFFVSKHHHHGTTYSADVTASALRDLNLRSKAKKIEAAWVAPDYDCISIYFNSPQQFHAAKRFLAQKAKHVVTCYDCNKARTDASTSCECGNSKLPSP